MPIKQEYAREILTGIETEFRAKIFGSLGFLDRLDNDDDWSFVIKVQALVEAAVTEAIVAKLGKVAVKNTVERLPLADEQIGKLALAKELNILTKEQRRFVRKMAELRNRLAHRVQDIDFTFKAYLESLSDAQAREWRESVVWFAAGKKHPQSWLDVAQKKPRFALYFAVFMLLAMLQIARMEAETPRKIEVAALRTAEEMFASIFDESPRG